MPRIILVLAGAAGLAAAAGSAVAATTTTTFAVTATVNANCLVAANPLNFATYTPGSGDLDVNTSLSVRCTRNTAYTVALNAGSTAGGSLSQRLMGNGTDTLQYNLFTTAARDTVWGDGTASTATIAGTGAGLGVPNAVTHTVYGRLVDSAANQAVSAGSYADTITVTVTY
ncbi:MAG: spore coat U domain-containing protein [Gammaproteobacteria bacterium]|nr:spore coat U domain-containing protein [Gammaproteobacteria bacterium]